MTFLSSLSSVHKHYTLIFHNGTVLRRQSPLVVAQYRSDARLAAVVSDGEVGLEGAGLVRAHVQR
jgi:hypothetical protein